MDAPEKISGRTALLAAALLVVVALAGLSQLELSIQDSSNRTWRQVPLEDVRNGESFTVSELEKPALVETFAVWCPTCTRQQEEVRKLHEQTSVNTVSLNVDPNEDASKIRSHIQKHGFDWRYAAAPPDLTKKLVENFGRSMIHPPSAPVVLVCENGSRKLQSGVKPVSKLKQEVQRGC
ncbi:MAG: peroxiredoxin family protein [Candidatus Nanohaloarchaea archaeon]